MVAMDRIDGIDHKSDMTISSQIDVVIEYQIARLRFSSDLASTVSYHLLLQHIADMGRPTRVGYKGNSLLLPSKKRTVIDKGRAPTARIPQLGLSKTHLLQRNSNHIGSAIPGQCIIMIEMIHTCGADTTDISESIGSKEQ